MNDVLHKHLHFRQSAADIGHAVLERLPSLLSAENVEGKRESDVTGFAGGLSGITLFLGRLYQTTHDEAFLSGATELLEHVIDHCNNKKTLNYSFLNGRSGAAYTLLEFYRITGKETYLTQAEKIALESTGEYLNYQYTDNSFSHGRAGTLFVMLQVYVARPQRQLLLGINTTIKRMMEDVRLSEHGIYWNDVADNSRGRNGLADRSGIAYTFLELGAFFRNACFNNLARLIFSHEDAAWSYETSNWNSPGEGIKRPDEYLQSQQMYAEANRDFFFTNPDDISVASGTAGIGLARISAFRRLGDNTYTNDIKRAYAKIKSSCAKSSDNSVYTGRSGYGLFCLEAFRAAGDQSYYETALAIADSILEKIDTVTATDGTDLSLLHGLSGVGCFFLQLQDPSNASSLLFPELKPTIEDVDTIAAYPMISICEPEMHRLLMEPYFNRTIHLLEIIAHEKLTQYFETTDIYPLNTDAFRKFVKSVIPSSEKYIRPVLQSLFDLENTRLSLDNSIISDAWLVMKEIDMLDQVDELFRKDVATILEKSVFINPEAKIFRVYNATSLQVEFFQAHPIKRQVQRVMLLPTAMLFRNKEIRKCNRFDFPLIEDHHTREILLGGFEKIFLKKIITSKKIKEIVAELADDAFFKRYIIFLYTYSKDAVFSERKSFQEIVLHFIRASMYRGLLRLSED